MVQDKGLNPNDGSVSARITNFVDDVVTVERKVATAMKANEDEIANPRYSLQPLFQIPNLGTIRDGFNWVQFFNTTLKESRPLIQPITHAILKTPKTISAVADTLKSVTTQQYNNYLVWRLTYSWLPDMSFEYNHMLMDWLATLMGKPHHYQSPWEFCMIRAETFMNSALDGVFVRYHFNQLDKYEVNYISESTRTSVAAEIDKLTWM